MTSHERVAAEVEQRLQARVTRDVEVGQALRRLSDARRAGAEHDDAAWRGLTSERWERRDVGLPDAIVQRIVSG